MQEMHCQKSFIQSASCTKFILSVLPNASSDNSWKSTLHTCPRLLSSTSLQSLWLCFWIQSRLMAWTKMGHLPSVLTSTLNGVRQVCPTQEVFTLGALSNPDTHQSQGTCTEISLLNWQRYLMSYRETGILYITLYFITYQYMTLDN